MKKLIIIVAVLLIMLMAGTVTAAAYGETEDLYSALPAETQELLNEAGIRSADAEELSGVGMEDVFRVVTLAAGKYGNAPFGAAAACMGIMLLCAAVKSRLYVSGIS